MIPSIIGVAGSWKPICQGTAASQNVKLVEKRIKIKDLKKLNFMYYIL
jgi:hypothetical protein